MDIKLFSANNGFLNILTFTKDFNNKHNTYICTLAYCGVIIQFMVIRFRDGIKILNHILYFNLVSQYNIIFARNLLFYFKQISIMCRYATDL